MDSTSTVTPRRTPLYERHLALHARMLPFGGFDMPIQYTGILLEHQACRQGIAIFDTCHMGEFFLTGSTALAALEKLVSCDVASLAIGQCRYGLLCNPDGGVRDDLLVYRLAAEAFMLVVNAGTQDDDFAWIASHCTRTTHIENRSDATTKLDIQGPGSARLMTKLLEKPIADLRFYRFMDNAYAGQPVIVSRTGYTGELGFEVYGDIVTGLKLWDECLAGGAVPAGLGARDTLRLEMGMPLYGHELGADRNGAESGLLASISTNKTYLGSTVLCDVAQRRQKLVGITLEGRRAARAGDSVLGPDGTTIGAVTSGSFSPSLGHAIALAYVDSAFASEGSPLQIQAAREALPGKITKPPFYRNATGRCPLADFL